SLEFQSGTRKFWLGTYGRDDPGGPVEQLRLTAGHWPSNNNEIALTRSFSNLNHISIGDTVKVVSVTQEPVLTVVAQLVDIDEGSADLSSQHAWVRESAIPGLTTPDLSFYKMDYRFATPPTSSQLEGDVDKLRASLPSGNVVGSVNYLLIRNVFNITNQIVTSVLLAFSVFALAATAAIVANLVTGIVISAYREIGILKALGFTPLQVDAVFVLQIVAPVAAASVVAIPLGTIGSQPLLGASSEALGLAYQPTFSLALDLLALAGALLIALVAALVPAIRAGRLKPAAVIANATAPRGNSGRTLRRLASRLGLPRSVVLGMGDAFARPARAGLTLLAIAIGVITVTVALGVPRSFQALNDNGTGAGRIDVVVHRSPAMSDADAMHLINSRPDTQSIVSQLGTNVTVPGIGDPVNAVLFRGDSTSLGFLLISGRWFSAPGEVLAPRALMQDAHLKVGDTFTSTHHGQPIRMLLVGEVFGISNLGHQLLMDISTLSASEAVTPDTYLVKLAPGANVDAYVRQLAATQPDLLDVQKNDTSLVAPVQIIDKVLLAVAAVVVVIGVAGIFNTLLLNTRERVRDTATLKAVGMSPRQMVVMVAATAGLLALVGGVIALPAGVGLNHVLLDFVSNAAGNDTPPAIYNMFAGWELAVLPFAGVAVAVAAALIPGRWAARTNVVEVLHAE
ncbi:MAG TPA: ABC transporter permease, partial [Candidatus Dormibacteraeota bacterium]|nr:ABC transporter permease [Candidatus Dormibacteraeota bacterium]